MKAALFDYELPEASIARHPTADRDGARLLVLEQAGTSHHRVRDLPELVPEGALVVVNDTRVRRARLFGQRRPGGGQVELFLLGPSEEASADSRERWRAIGRANKPLRPGTTITVGELEIQIERTTEQGVLELAIQSPEPVEQALERLGHVPIPPYLRRGDEPLDVERYQTVYARRTASVAAPTAGLHFTPELFERLLTRGRRLARLELEVGLGTFRPVTTEDLDQHPMHAERYTISPDLAREIHEARVRGAPVIAIGTTVVRALESAADPAREGEVLARSAETQLLIQPGYRFRVVDGLFTNFHQPRSTLLALVAAFVGLEPLLAAYQAALAEQYRFLSYGDAMWIPRGAIPSRGTEGRRPGS